MYLLVTIICLVLGAGLSFVFEETTPPDIVFSKDGTRNVSLPGGRETIPAREMEKIYEASPRTGLKENETMETRSGTAIDEATLDRLRKTYGERIDRADPEELRKIYEEFINKKGRAR